MQHNVTLLRGAPVKVEATYTPGKKRHPIANLIIDNKYHHTFESASRVSKHLETMSPADLQSRLTGGDYFLVDGELVDFRDNRYNGFIHEDKTIATLNRIIGITDKDAAERTNNRRRKQFINLASMSSRFLLGTKWSDHGIDIPQYKDGGVFTSALWFNWSPFVKTVGSSFMLWRMICSNGMRGLTSFLNTKIPLINRWEEHLEMANRQIQNKVDGKVKSRLLQMGTERASVAEAMLVTSHAHARSNNNDATLGDRTRMSSIIAIASPKLHLAKVYRENVFNDKRVAAQSPSHLTTFDVYNMATEIRSHSNENSKSTDHALDQLANDLVFNDKRCNVLHAAARFAQPGLSSFSDPEMAFYGEVA